MQNSGRCRANAAECLLAAQAACQPHYRKLHLSMAVSWLSLARQDEAIDNLLASWDMAAPVKTDGPYTQFIRAVVSPLCLLMQSGAVRNVVGIYAARSPAM